MGGQGSSPQQVYFGTEYLKFSGFVLPIDVLASIYFILIALAFVGLGQAIGLAFEQGTGPFGCVYQQHWWEYGRHRSFCPGVLLQDDALHLVRSRSDTLVVLPQTAEPPATHRSRRNTFSA